MNHPPCCTPAVRRARRLLVLALVAGALLLPFLARSQEPPAAPEEATAGAPHEVVAEALYLCDPLPPGGRDLNLSVAVAEGEPDPVTGASELTASPRVQLALPLGERVGLTVDTGLVGEGVPLEAPAASLKVLLRAPGAHATGLAASLDLYDANHSLRGSEAGATVGAIRALGRLALRASASLASRVSGWSPHLHGGLSAALALGPRWRALAEVVAEVSGGQAAVSAGPTLKLALREGTAVMAGALLAITTASAAPTFTVQLTQSM